MVERFKTLLINSPERSRLTAIRLQQMHSSQPNNAIFSAATINWECLIRTTDEGIEAPMFCITSIDMDFREITGHNEKASVKPKDHTIINWQPNEQNCIFKGWHAPAGLAPTSLLVDFKGRSVVADFGHG